MRNCKEYLVPDNGGYRVAVQDAGLPISEEWIEIPEGAEILIEYESGHQEFFKNFFEDCYHEDGFWFRCDDMPRFYRSGNVVWQRPTQPEALPFIDDNPQSLNDQYAEIEEVRQHKSSAWDTQVGGNHYKQFKIQPMQFALENKLDAAQQNIIKYIMRHSFKNGKQDLEKAKHYVDLMIEFYYGDGNNG